MHREEATTARELHIQAWLGQRSTAVSQILRMREFVGADYGWTAGTSHYEGTLERTKYERSKDAVNSSQPRQTPLQGSSS